MQKVVMLILFLNAFACAKVQVRQAVIPSAGFGTRFLPTTSQVDKGLLPINEKPVVHFVAQEAMSAGIDQLFFVVNPRKLDIVNYFSIDPALVEFLRSKNKLSFLESLYALTNHFTVVPVFQVEQLGLAHAILCAREYITDDYFAVMLPDNLIVASVSGIQQLISVAEKYNASVIAVERLCAQKISLYAEMHVGSKLEKGVYQLTGVREKPAASEVVSNFSIIGRAVFHKNIFNSLACIEPGVNGEYNWTDAIADMIEKGQTVLVYEIEGRRFDTGHPKRWAQAVEYYVKL